MKKIIVILFISSLSFSVQSQSHVPDSMDLGVWVPKINILFPGASMEFGVIKNTSVALDLGLDFRLNFLRTAVAGDLDTRLAIRPYARVEPRYYFNQILKYSFVDGIYVGARYTQGLSKINTFDFEEFDTETSWSYLGPVIGVQQKILDNLYYDVGGTVGNYYMNNESFFGYQFILRFWFIL